MTTTDPVTLVSARTLSDLRVCFSMTKGLKPSLIVAQAAEPTPTSPSATAPTEPHKSETLPLSRRRADSWNTFLRHRFHPNHNESTVHWAYSGELFNLNSGALIARVEGFETSRVLAASQSPLVTAARSGATAPLASQTVLCRKLFAFRPVRTSRTLGAAGNDLQRIDDTDHIHAVKWCREGAAFLLAYPYQVLTFVHDASGTFKLVAEQGDSSGNARQLVASLTPESDSTRFERSRKQRIDSRATAWPSTRPLASENTLRLSLYVRPLTRSRTPFASGAFELYEIHPAEPPSVPAWKRVLRLPSPWWWMRSWHKVAAEQVQKQSNLDWADDRADAGASMEHIKVGDCPSWAGLGVHNKCLLLLRGRRVDAQAAKHSMLSPFLRGILERNPLYWQAPADLAEIGTLQAQQHGLARKASRRPAPR